MEFCFRCDVKPFHPFRSQQKGLLISTRLLSRNVQYRTHLYLLPKNHATTATMFGVAAGCGSIGSDRVRPRKAITSENTPSGPQTAELGVAGVWGSRESES